MRPGIEKVDFTATKYVCSKMQDLSLRLSFIPEEFQLFLVVIIQKMKTEN